MENPAELLIIEESWEQILALSKDKMSLHQIAFEIGVKPVTLKKYVSIVALEKKVLEGNITAIQIQENLNDAVNFQKIKKSVWDL